MAGELSKALRAFLEARKLQAFEDNTDDSGRFHKWLGICYALLEKQRDATASLDRAWRILYRPGIKPEDWYEVLLWHEKLTVDANASDLFSRRLQALGWPPYLFVGQPPFEKSQSKTEVFSISSTNTTRMYRHFDRGSDIAWSGDQARIGLDQMDKLIYSLIYSGRFGMPQYRLYEVLWPDELFSFEQHAKRLEQLVIRARNEGFKIMWKNLHLTLESCEVSAGGCPRQVVRGLIFLESNPIFARSDVQKFFSLSRASAIRLCRHWKEAGLTAPLDESRYRVVSERIRGSKS